MRKMEQHLEQRLQTKLFMSKHLQQSLSLLTYSYEELLDCLQEKAESNPLLEIDFPLPHPGNTNMTEYIAHEQVPSLETVLLEQLASLRLPAAAHAELLYLVEHVTEDGYLQCDLEEMADIFSIPLEHCEKQVKALQQFEPAGVGARNLQECLILQLRDCQEVPDYIAPIIKNDLELLADQQFWKLAQKYNITEEDADSCLSLIRRLKPSLRADHERYENTYMFPEILVETIGQEVVVQLQKKYFPAISINEVYQELLKDHGEDHYLKIHLSEALRLKSGVTNRYETLFRVAKTAVEYQSAFFLGGKPLRALRMRDMASMLGLHVSTISRAVHEKYIQTPKGVLPLKSLFERGVHNESLEHVSRSFIQLKIKEIIDGENKQKPFSDQQIAALLMLQSIQVTRRTVAKYREQLRLPSSIDRKERKNRL